jgi:hypothetical protein
VSSVGEEVYLALDKGPISPQHALIIPIEHHPSLAALPPAAAEEVGRWVREKHGFGGCMGAHGVQAQGLLLLGGEAVSWGRVWVTDVRISAAVPDNLAVCL